MSLNCILACVCGLLCLAASFCVGAHEILMSPARPNYPKGGGRLRVLMFVWSGVLIYRAMEYLQGAVTGTALPVTVGQIGGCILVAAVHATFLEDHLRKWLPARTHRYIQRLLDIATCGRAEALRQERKRQNAALWPGVKPGAENPDVTGPALAQLMLEGVRVIAPNEGPLSASRLPGQDHLTD